MDQQEERVADLPARSVDPMDSGGNCGTRSAATLHPVSGRNVAALLNPRPVALIGACEAASEDTGLRVDFATVAWVTPLSHDPALVAFALRPSSKTFCTLIGSRSFSINTLDAESVDIARLCGNASGHTQDKGARVAHILCEHLPYTGQVAELPASATDIRRASKQDPCPLVPYVSGALSVLDCEVESVRSAGDHELVVAYVCKASTRCPEDRAGSIIATDTLLCLQHDAFAVAGGTF